MISLSIFFACMADQEVINEWPLKGSFLFVHLYPPFFFLSTNKQSDHLIVCFFPFGSHKLVHTANSIHTSTAAWPLYHPKQQAKPAYYFKVKIDKTYQYHPHLSQIEASKDNQTRDFVTENSLWWHAGSEAQVNCNLAPHRSLLVIFKG